MKMDKRYFIIIIIIFVCCFNLFMIANFSDVVGSASVHVGNYTFSLPEGFTLYDNENNRVHIYNSNTKAHIMVYYPIAKDDTFLNKYNEIKNDSQYRVLSNGTVTSNGITIESVFYQKTSDLDNRSTFYFTKYDEHFRILLSGFDYNTHKNETINIVTQIVDTIRTNHEVTG